MRRNKQAFTLIELLVVVLITAVMGSVGYQMLGTAVRMSDTTARHADELNQVSRAINWLQSDTQQYAARPVRDKLGESWPSLVVSNQGLSFTHLGKANTFDKAQSQLQRVSYQLVGGHLQRVVWPVLDRGQDTTPQIQELLQATRFSVKVLTVDGWHEQWPVTSSLPGQESLSDAIALRITLDTATFGVVTRLFELPLGLAIQRLEDE